MQAIEWKDADQNLSMKKPEGFRTSKTAYAHSRKYQLLLSCEIGLSRSGKAGKLLLKSVWDKS
jgi:hypothetical protein